MPDLFDGLVDASDRPEGGDGNLVTSWLNDIEEERRYAGWRSDFAMVSRELTLYHGPEAVD